MIKSSSFPCCITVYHITFYAHTHCNARLVPFYLHTVLPQSNTLCPLQLISFFHGAIFILHATQPVLIASYHSEYTSQRVSLPYMHVIFQ